MVKKLKLFFFHNLVAVCTPLRRSVIEKHHRRQFHNIYQTIRMH